MQRAQGTVRHRLRSIVDDFQGRQIVRLRRAAQQQQIEKGGRRGRRLDLVRRDRLAAAEWRPCAGNNQLAAVEEDIEQSIEPTYVIKQKKGDRSQTALAYSVSLLERHRAVDACFGRACGAG